MKALMPWQIDLLPWYVFGAYWAISALQVKRTKAAEKSIDRLFTLILMVAAFFLLFYDMRLGPLEQRFLPLDNTIEWAGVVTTSLGILLAIWARYSLGPYWSARVTLKEEHRLIRSGPYRLVRHPIYTGMFLGALGRALTLGEWRGVVAVVLVLAAHTRKAMREESLLTREFGDEYASYRRNTGFLFPRLGGPAGME
jgi:protein-S-isoprenylcysteine O-methyltransferase Ste14